MKFSENWLRTLVALPECVDRAVLCRRLTMAGLEVESVEVQGEALADEVVVARVVDAVRHPDAAKLQVCQVDAGENETLQIVCGAPNARAGLKTALAKIGAKLPGGLEIKMAQLRGVASSGMLCAAEELGLDIPGEGIIELPDDAAVGQPLKLHLGLPDAVITLKLTPNRADCLSMFGLAKEVAALFDCPLRLEGTDLARQGHAQAVGSKQVGIQATDACSEYVGCVLRNIDPRATTPAWMKERLRRSGIRAIGPVVDCTNYVMLETGQPLHAFDSDVISGGILVRYARPKEKIVLLDEREVKLDPDFLVIADERQLLAVAGVMGGHDGRVTSETRHLFLESAHFAPAVVAGRARRLGLHTEASHRFERGVDPAMPAHAMHRLAELLTQIVGGEPETLIRASTVSPPQPAPKIPLRYARALLVLGLDTDSLPRAEVQAILRRLGMTVIAGTGADWEVVPPSARFDLALEEDLIEEIGRIYGYERIPQRVPAATVSQIDARGTEIKPAALKNTLLARGYTEAVNLSFLPQALLAQWGMDAAAVLANPLSADLAAMRPSLLPGLMMALRHNRARQQDRIKLFEIGRVFRLRENEVVEETMIAGVCSGRAEQENWNSAKREFDFFDVKGDVEALLVHQGGEKILDDFAFEPIAPQNALHPGRSARLRNKRTLAEVGLIGCIHPVLAQALDLKTDAYVFELFLSQLLERSLPRIQAVSRYPSIRRDIALIIAKIHPYSEIYHYIKELFEGKLKELVLFDEYLGDNLEQGTRSLAMGLILQDDLKTMTDQEADEIVAGVLEAVSRKFGAALR